MCKNKSISTSNKRKHKRLANIEEEPKRSAEEVVCKENTMVKTSSASEFDNHLNYERRLPLWLEREEYIMSSSSPDCYFEQGYLYNEKPSNQQKTRLLPPKYSQDHSTWSKENTESEFHTYLESKAPNQSNILKTYFQYTAEQDVSTLPIRPPANMQLTGSIYSIHARNKSSHLSSKSNDSQQMSKINSINSLKSNSNAVSPVTSRFTTNDPHDTFSTKQKLTSSANITNYSNTFAVYRVYNQMPRPKAVQLGSASCCSVRFFKNIDDYDKRSMFNNIGPYQNERDEDGRICVPRCPRNDGGGTFMKNYYKALKEQRRTSTLHGTRLDKAFMSCPYRTSTRCCNTGFQCNDNIGILNNVSCQCEFKNNRKQSRDCDIFYRDRGITCYPPDEAPTKCSKCCAADNFRANQNCPRRGARRSVNIGSNFCFQVRFFNRKRKRGKYCCNTSNIPACGEPCSYYLPTGREGDDCCCSCSNIHNKTKSKSILSIFSSKTSCKFSKLPCNCTDVGTICNSCNIPPCRKANNMLSIFSRKKQNNLGCCCITRREQNSNCCCNKNEIQNNGTKDGASCCCEKNPTENNKPKISFTWPISISSRKNNLPCDKCNASTSNTQCKCKCKKDAGDFDYKKVLSEMILSRSQQTNQCPCHSKQNYTKTFGRLLLYDAVIKPKCCTRETCGNTSLSRSVGIGKADFRVPPCNPEYNSCPRTNNTKLNMIKMFCKAIRREPSKKMQYHNYNPLIHSEAGIQHNSMFGADERAGKEVICKNQGSYVPFKPPTVKEYESTVMAAPVQPQDPNRKAYRIGSNLSCSFEVYKGSPPKSPPKSPPTVTTPPNQSSSEPSTLNNARTEPDCGCTSTGPHFVKKAFAGLILRSQKPVTRKSSRCQKCNNCVRDPLIKRGFAQLLLADSKPSKGTKACIITDKGEGLVKRKIGNTKRSSGDSPKCDPYVCLKRINKRQCCDPCD